MTLQPITDEPPTRARSASSPIVTGIRMILLAIALASCVISGGDGAGHTAGTDDLAATVLDVEDFEDGVANGWTVIDGTWDIITDGTKTWHTQPTDALARATAGDTAWTNYTTELMVKTVAWADPASPGAVGVMARVVDLNNYYFFVFSTNELRIKKQVDGVFTTLASKPYMQTLGAWYKLRAQVDGEVLGLYVDDTLELGATDSALPAGKIGLLAVGGDTRYDNITVSSTITPSPSTGTSVTYGYTPPAQTVHESVSTSHVVPAGYIHQTAWASTTKPDVLGVYAYDLNTWSSLVWRWADTMRPDAIQHVTGPGGTPAYRFELTNSDTSSPGTSGDHPRAELFSVSAAEDRRQVVPPRANILREGDEYWATWAMYLAPDFPTTHNWATLIQRKFQNGVTYNVNWFSLNAHKNTIDFSPPGAPKDTYVPISTVTALRGRWTQFTIHERMSSGPSGYFELYMDGQRVGERSGPTIQAGDINHNFHYGYYRGNESQPGVGVVYFSPFMISRGASPGLIPVLP